MFQLAAENMELRTRSRYGKDIKVVLQAELCSQERRKHLGFPSSFAAPSCVAVIPSSVQVAAFQHSDMDPCSRGNALMLCKFCFTCWAAALPKVILQAHIHTSMHTCTEIQIQEMGWGSAFNGILF